MLSNITQWSVRSLRSLKTFPLTDLKLVATTVRWRTRWVSRRPVAIVNEDEIFGSEKNVSDNVVQQSKVSPSKMKKNASRMKAEKDPLTKKTSKFVSLKEDDRIITSLMTKIRSRKRRTKNEEVVLEGHRMIKDGIEAGAEPKVIFFSKVSDIEKLPLPQNVQLYKIPYRTIQLWSSVTTSPGLLGIFTTPEVHNKEPSYDALPLTIICDNVREPGNLGSILRAAAGVGCEKLILLKGCVDLWEPKVLRSAAGAHFRLPIHSLLLWDDIPQLINQHSRIIVTDSNFNCGSESTNVSDDLNTGTDSEGYDAKSTLENNHINEITKPKTKYRNEKEAVKKFMSRLPIVPYHSVNYTDNEVVLVISGETEGLSSDSCELLKERETIRVNIPLANGVDSLNTGVALGIVTFEIKRQFMAKQKEM